MREHTTSGLSCVNQESSKRGPPPDKRLVEYQFAFSCVWAFGGPLSVDKVADHRANFSNWWVTEWKNVSFPDKVRIAN